MIEKEKNGYFWNSAAGLLNAGEAVILSMVVTRISGLADAGVLSMAFAVGNLMMTIGKFGVRSYQATDVEEGFSFAEYFRARMVTVVLMAAASLLYVCCGIRWRAYGIRKAAIILSFCFIYLVESVEDVFWGLYQLRQSLDTGAKLFLLRWTVILSVCIGILFVSKDLSVAAVSGAAAGFVVSSISNVFVFRGTGEKLCIGSVGSVIRILRQCLPLFLASFLTIYVTNAPKYAIDRWLTQEMQACYGFLSMPVFVVELLNGFLYQPSLVHMALEWKEGKLMQLRRRVKRQCAVLLGLTCVCLAGAYVCGIPVLSAIYGTDLSGYRRELLVLLCGGGMLGYAGYFGVLLTVMRRQEAVMYGYVGAALLALSLSNGAVRNYGIIGAAGLSALLMSVLAAFFAFMYLKEIVLINQNT